MKLEFICWKTNGNKWVIYLQPIVGTVTLSINPISWQFETREEALEWLKEIIGKEGITIKLPT